MIVRTVYLKLTDEHATDQGRAQVAARTRAVMAELPMVIGCDVGIPSDAESLRAWDIAIHIRFGSMEDVGPYVIHPIHASYVTEYLTPRVVVKKAWNFAVAQQ